MKDTSWNIPYIHGADQESNNASHAEQFNTSFTILLNDQKREFTSEEFLQAAWTNGFDTTCTSCGNPFDLAVSPPVRLLGLREDEISDPSMTKHPPMVIKNFHMKCLKDNKIKFVPVSHPWHSSIAEAYALQVFNARAGQTCYEAPMRTLLGVTRTFGHDYLLWHDYISIPQWQEDFRGTVILPQIFKIFEHSGRSILHLGHRPPDEIVRNPTLATIHEHNDDLVKFLNAHLFSRLWPIVESDRAGDLFIMDNNYDIMDIKLSSFVQSLFDALSADTAKSSPEHLRSAQWLYDLPLFLREQQPKKTLGYVYDMIATLGCRSFRDKFIGASELLQVPNYPPDLPADTQDACLWLSERQIERNDLSALLLAPCTKSSHPKAAWVRGHTDITRGMWGWGVEKCPSEFNPRVEAHAIHMNMRRVGRISHVATWESMGNDLDYKLPKSLEEAISSCQGVAARFGQSLHQMDILKLLPPQQRAPQDSSPQHKQQLFSSSVLDRALKCLLESYSMQIEDQNTSTQGTMHDRLVALVMLLACELGTSLDKFADLDAHTLLKHLCDSSELTLLTVTCEDCHEISFVRSRIWQTPTNKAQLYLFRGLEYQYSIEGGVGIILEEGIIIGRTRFCVPARRCNKFVDVVVR